MQYGSRCREMNVGDGALTYGSIVCVCRVQLLIHKHAGLWAAVCPWSARASPVQTALKV